MVKRVNWCHKVQVPETDNPPLTMPRFSLSEFIMLAILVVVMAVLTWLLLTFESWLTFALVVLNLMLLLPLMLKFVTPELSLSILTALSEIFFAPFWRIADFTGHLGPSAALQVRPLGNPRDHRRSFDLYTDDDDKREDCVPGWVRQTAFILTVVLDHRFSGDKGEGWRFGPLAARFLFWTVGVRISLIFTSVLLYIWKEGGSESYAIFPHLQNRPGPPCPRQNPNPFPCQNSNPSPSANNPTPIGDSSSASWLRTYVLLMLCIAAVTLFHMSLNISAGDLAGTVLFIVCSDTNVQDALKRVVRCRVEVDWAEGFEPEIMHGLLFVLDFSVSMCMLVRSYARDDRLVIVLSYCILFTAISEFRARVWLEIRQGVRRLPPGLHRATMEELRSHNEMCGVCLGPKSAARITECDHLFHGRCLRQALRVSTQCPFCKNL